MVWSFFLLSIGKRGKERRPRRNNNDLTIIVPIFLQSFSLLVDTSSLAWSFWSGPFYFIKMAFLLSLFFRLLPSLCCCPCGLLTQASPPSRFDFLLLRRHLSSFYLLDAVATRPSTVWRVAPFIFAFSSPPLLLKILLLRKRINHHHRRQQTPTKINKSSRISDLAAAGVQEAGKSLPLLSCILFREPEDPWELPLS